VSENELISLHIPVKMLIDLLSIIEKNNYTGITPSDIAFFEYLCIKIISEHPELHKFEGLKWLGLLPDKNVEMAGYIYFKLSFERYNYIVSIGLTEGVGNVLSRREVDSKIGEDILIWVVLVAADAEIDAGRLKEVKAGDMMVFKNAYIKIYDDGRPGGIVMVKTFDGNVIGKYDIENQRLMNGDSYGEKDNMGVPEGIIDGVPITLSIELQRIKTSIKELKNIIKGQLIEIHKKIPDEVIISANGKIIGTGRLLKVNDCLCVEVLTIDG